MRKYVKHVKGKDATKHQHIGLGALNFLGGDSVGMYVMIA